MRFLFIHQNFPGQFRHVVQALADDPAHEVIGIGDTGNVKGRPALHPRLRVLGYQPSGSGHKDTHHYVRDFESHVRRGQAVVRVLLKLRDEAGFRPDVVVAHPGWGEGLFLKDIFPEARIVQYFEFYYHGVEGDVSFDREFPSTLDDQLRVRIKNSTQLHSLLGCDQGLSPTTWQQTRYPAEFRHKIEVIHEGIDTGVVKPAPSAWVEINGQRLQAGDEIVTYVARNLEPYRGFHSFIRSLPALQALRPGARVIIVGGDEVSYGRRLPKGQSYRQRYCAEVHDQVDWSKVFFVGKLPYGDYLKVLQVSAAHVYLTYPFVLSWSMLEAMAAGCLMVASDTAPVTEVIREGENGLLVDFFDPARLAQRLAEVLADPAPLKKLRDNARQTIIERYDLKTICLPRMLSILRGD
ncbi:MAG: glycosyltransferase family 4 protein [Hydrogenophaga sp.]|jgi:glycosyltransferase involved in cell wall biosynthesis|nr:glycosyltransferase family 4 protein [Hydrogenophaga sp.]